MPPVHPIRSSWWSACCCSAALYLLNFFLRALQQPQHGGYHATIPTKDLSALTPGCALRSSISYLHTNGVEEYVFFLYLFMLFDNYIHKHADITALQRIL